MKKALNHKLNLIFVYVAIILLGAIFIILPCIHKNLWFDESYSVAIANHKFADIWAIGSNDVHPILYYCMLRIVKVLFNNNIIACRILSCVPLIIMSILGYTHIRKDFGNKVGLLFSFFILFWPTSIMYSGEIRMYTWSMLFVAVMSIYTYRIFKDEFKVHNWVLFVIFSICACYSHYYALILVFIENVMLFFYFGNKTLKKKEKYYKNKFRASTISAIIIVVAYIPWIGSFLSQAKNVSEGFWIGFPNYFSVVKFLFTGMIDYEKNIQGYVANVFAWCSLIYVIYLLKKNIKNDNTVKHCLWILVALTIIVSVASIIQPILYARYFLNYSGIFIFMLVLLLSKDDSKRVLTFWIITVLVSTIININLINQNYDESNQIPINYISERMQENDIIITDADGFSGFAAIAELNFEDSKSYFLNDNNWNVEEAYKAFGKTIYDFDEFKEYKGQIWIVSGGDGLANKVKDELENIQILEEQHFETKYRNQDYSIVLINKN